MWRLLWGAVALLAVILAVVFVPAGPGGPVPEQALAHIITPTGTPGPPMFHAEIDADARNGNRPCDPLDATAEVGGRHEVAVCITNAPASVGSFSFRLVYDSTVQQCVQGDFPTPEPAVDANPDANLGLTLGGGAPTNPDLGSGSDCGQRWDCSSSGTDPPQCDWYYSTETDAYLSCRGNCGPYTSPVDAGPWPLAAVTFDAALPGVDTLTLADLRIGTYILPSYDFEEIGSCNPVDQVEVPCLSATLFVQAPIGGIAEAPLSEGDVLAGEGTSSMPNALALAALAAGGALLLAAGAWYARRRWRAG
jgi:hypothetical protein